MHKHSLLPLSVSLALAATAGIAAAPAPAQPGPVTVTAPPPEPVPTRRVSYADLDLANAEGQIVLHRRVRVAVLDVCRESVGLMPPMFVEQKCRSEAWDGARRQIAQAVLRAQQIASTGSSSIAAGSIAISLSR